MAYTKGFPFRVKARGGARTVVLVDGRRALSKKSHLFRVAGAAFWSSLDPLAV